MIERRTPDLRPVGSAAAGDRLRSIKPTVGRSELLKLTEIVPGTSVTKKGRPEDWKAVAEAIRAACAIRGSRPATVREYATALKILAALAPTPAELSIERLLAYVHLRNQNGYRRKKTKNVLGLLIRIMRTTVDRAFGMSGADDLSAVVARLIDEPDPIPTREDLIAIDEQICYEIGQARTINEPDRLWRLRRLQALYTILMYSALRPGEALGLAIDDYGLPPPELANSAATRYLYVAANRAREIKPKARRIEPVAQAAVETLDAWRSICGSARWLFPLINDHGKPWSSPTHVSARAGTQLAAIAKRAGVRVHVTLRSIRKASATAFANQPGVTAANVRDFLGHTQLSTSAYYVRADVRELAERVAGFTIR